MRVVTYNRNIPHLDVGYNPFTNHLLTSWDIRVDVFAVCLPYVWYVPSENYVIGGLVSHAFIHPLHVMYEKIRYKDR